MTDIEKIALLEECMDIDEGTLKMSDLLSDYEEWDSLTALSVIAMADEKFHKMLTGEDIKKAVKVSDIVAYLE